MRAGTDKAIRSGATALRSAAPIPTWICWARTYVLDIALDQRRLAISHGGKSEPILVQSNSSTRSMADE